MWAQSVGPFAPFCGPCGMMNGVVAKFRLPNTVNIYLERFILN